jgi:hypothetical protein
MNYRLSQLLRIKKVISDTPNSHLKVNDRVADRKQQSDAPARIKRSFASGSD